MTITTQCTTANSPAQKNRVRGPTVAARRRGAVDAARFAASRATGAATARPGGRPRNEAKRWASGKSRKTGFAKARATFRGGGRGSAAAAERHDSMMTKARWRGTEAIARETPAGSLSVASMPQRKDYTNDAEHHGKFQVNKNGHLSTVRWVKRNRSPPLRSLCRVLCGCGRRLAGVVLPVGD